MPKFSIIIPVYNVAPYLCECLDSVHIQTFTDWECICVDDGSTDGSGVILDEYGSKDSRFKVIHQSNKGVSAARNAALDVAQGDWVWFVDGDDVISGNALALLAVVIGCHSEIDALRLEFITTGIFELDRNEVGLPVAQVIEVIDTSKKVLVRDVDSYMCQIVYRRSRIEAIRFPNGIARGEDRVFVTDFMLMSCRGYARTNMRLYYYRQRESSAMHTKSTFLIVRSEMDFRMIQLSIVGRTSKELDSVIAPMLIGRFFAGYHVKMIEDCDAEDRRRVYQYWYSKIDALKSITCLPRPTLRRIKIDAFFKLPIVTRNVYWGLGLKDKWVSNLRSNNVVRRIARVLRVQNLMKGMFK